MKLLFSVFCFFFMFLREEGKKIKLSFLLLSQHMEIKRKSNKNFFNNNMSKMTKIITMLKV